MAVSRSDLTTGDRSHRRNFLKLPLAAGATGALLYAASRNGESVEADTPKANQRSAGPVIDEFDPGNIKLAHRLSSQMSDEDLLFLKQIGMRWARVNFPTDRASLDQMHATQKRFDKFGLKIYSAVHYSYRNLNVQPAHAARYELTDPYRVFPRNCGTLGIPLALYDCHPGNTYTTGHVERRGYVAREFNLDDFRKRVEKQRFDREYAAEEIWDCYTYFMRAVLPVAEESNVKMALHPDDPPVAKMNGVAKLFTHADGYRRAEKIAGASRHWGLTFCVGTWAEGGDKMGLDVFEMIKEFGSRGRIFGVHFRNVSAPLPHFVETFLDDGYLDMYQVMKALREVRYDGTIVPDHIPQLKGDTGMRHAGTAYCLAYMRALLRRANEEVG